MRPIKSFKSLRSTVTAVLTLLILFGCGAMTVLRNAKALLAFEGETVTEKIRLERQAIETAFDTGFYRFDNFISVYAGVQNILGADVFEDAMYTYMIRDNHNGLHFYTPAEDAAPYAGAVNKLNERLSAAGIPLLYLQAPNKYIEGYTEFPLGMDSAATANADAMLRLLQEGGTNALSFRQVLASQAFDPALMFYRTDHHWTTQAAFSAYDYTVSYLNETYAFGLDTGKTAPEAWEALSFENYFLGSQGRRVSATLCGLDDYTCLLPRFSTSYDIYNPYESEDTPQWQGTFRETIIRDQLLLSDDVAQNRYASYFQYDFGHLRIENLEMDNDLTVAIVKDSFALPFTAFLSTCFQTTHMMDLRGFTGNLTETLLQIRPDLVIILYGNASFSPEMYRFDTMLESGQAVQ